MGAGAAVDACFRPFGYALVSGDCDDADALAHPGAGEVCDGRDDDCDGAVDAADADYAGLATWHRDADRDGFGTDETFAACSAGAGWARVSGDCDDAAASSWPGAPEACSDGVDSDCDGVSTCTMADADHTIVGRDADARFGFSPFALDSDGDGVSELAFGLGGPCSSATAPGAILALFADPLAADSLAHASFVLEADAVGDCAARARSAGDVDGDGGDDLWVATRELPVNTGSVRVFTGVAAGAREVSAPDGVWYGDHYDSLSDVLAAGDLDGDGRAEAWISGPRVWLLSPGLAPSGRIRDAASAAIVPGEEGHVRGHASVDNDGDGLPELWASASGREGSSTESEILVFAEPPSGNVGLDDADAVIAFFGRPDWSFGSVHPAGDVDGDGREDLWIDDWLVTTIGEGSIETWATSQVSYGIKVPLGDVDGDGHPDAALAGFLGVDGTAIVAGPLDGPLDAGSVLLNLGALRYPAMAAGPVDLDGDGRGDLVITDSDGPDGLPGAGAVQIILGSSL